MLVKPDRRVGQMFTAFHLDRPSSLSLYLREIGKLFPLLPEPIRAQKLASDDARKADEYV